MATIPKGCGRWRAVAPKAGRVTVVAPATNQTAVGGGYTLRRQLQWDRIDSPVPGVDAWKVDGTPADCVMVAFNKLLDHDVSLVVSGVNDGANVGNDVLASGTVGGAQTGHWRGKTAVAFSQAKSSRDSAAHWPVAERVAALLCRAELEGELPESVFLNVNIPNCPWEEIAGVLVTRMGRSGYVKLREMSENTAVLERQYDMHTNPDVPPGTDIWALLHNYVSVSPLQSNLTDYHLLDLLGQRLNAAFLA